MKTKILLFLFFFFLALFGQAQDEKLLRVELETAKDNNDYKCVPVSEKGVIVFYEGNQLKSDSLQWIIMHYDTNLHKTANYQIFFPKNVDFVMSYYDHQTSSVFLLFQTPYQKKEPFISFLVEFDLNSFKSSLYTIDELKDQSLFFLKVVDSKAIMVSYAKEKYDIYLYDLRLKSLKSPLFSNNQILSVEFCEADTLLKLLNWGIIFQETSKYSYTEWIETQYDGTVIRREILPAYTGYNYHVARFAITDSAKYLIVGTFTNDDNKVSGSLYSGIYAITVANNKMGDPQYYNYTNIKSKSAVISDNTKNKGQTLQELIGPLFCEKEKYSLVSEVFYPEYTQSYTNSGAYDSYYYNRYGYNNYPTTVFAGYRYVNAFVVTFDENGKLLWDHYMPFSNVLTERLINRITVWNNEDYSVIFYPYNDRITSTMLSGYETIEPLQSIKLATNSKKDVVEYSKSNYFIQWYNDKFLGYGYQYIKNSRTKRYVFYMNALGYK